MKIPSLTLVTIIARYVAGESVEGIAPIPVTPFDKESCGALVEADAKYSTCNAPGWVYCINAICESTPTVDENYGGKPYVQCQCWQQSTSTPMTDFSIIPPPQDGGANCVLESGPGGDQMCEAIQNGQLISTYGPFGELRDNTPQFALESAVCTSGTPWAWCWGAPCRAVDTNVSPTGIVCDCPYMISISNKPQTISLTGQGECAPTFDYNPCMTGIHNSMPSGTAPSGYMTNKRCYVEPGVPSANLRRGVGSLDFM